MLDDGGGGGVLDMVTGLKGPLGGRVACQRQIGRIVLGLSERDAQFMEAVSNSKNPITVWEFISYFSRLFQSS